MDIEHNLNETPWLKDLLTNGATISPRDIQLHIKADADKSMLSVSGCVGANIDVTPTLSDELKQTVREISLTISDISDSPPRLETGEISVHGRNSVVNPAKIYALEEMLVDFCDNAVQPTGTGRDTLYFEIKNSQSFCDFLKHMETEDFKQAWDAKTIAIYSRSVPLDPPTPEPPGNW